MDCAQEPEYRKSCIQELDGDELQISRKIGDKEITMLRTRNGKCGWYERKEPFE